MITPYRPDRDVTPYRPCVVDIETAPSGEVIAIGFAYAESDGTVQYRTFPDWSEWWDYVTRSLTNREARYRTFYAHNGLGFDWLSFIRWGESREEIGGLRYIFNGGFGIGATFKVGRYTYHLRDSMRLLPGSLDAVCKAFSTEYQKRDVPEHYKSHMDEYLRDHPREFWKYLRADCLSLQEALYRFWSIIYAEVGSIDRLPLTLPSLAMKLFRMTLTEPIMVPWNTELKVLERRAYTGGRTECYHSGVADVTVYDVNSEYPYVMREGDVPVSYVGAWTDRYQGLPGIYAIDYAQTNRTYLPVLRDETTQAFQYEGSGVYTQPEIELLLFVGGVIRVREGYVYEETGNVFRPFVERWWGLRQQAIRDGNAGLSYVAKIMMNSLYGKFGQKETGSILVESTEERYASLMDSDAEFLDMGDYLIVQEDIRSEYTFVGIAAYITAMARVHLYASIMDAQAKGGRVWAVDTDSVHVEGVTLPTDPTSLGALKQEYTGETAYLGKKLYSQSGGAIKSKGVNPKSARIVDPVTGEPTPEPLTHTVMLALATGRMATARLAFPCAPSFREVLIKGQDPCKFTDRERTIQPTSPPLPLAIGEGIVSQPPPDGISE